MEQKDISLRLILGKPLSVDEYVWIYPLTINQICEMNESVYYGYLSQICFDMDDLPLELEQIEKLQEEGKDEFFMFQYLTMLYEEYRNQISRYFDLIFNQNVYYSELKAMFYLTFDKKNEQGNFIYDENGYLEEEYIYIDKDRFYKLRELLLKQNMVKKQKQDYNPANESAKNFIKKLRKKNQRMKEVQSKDKHSLVSIISSVAWKSGCGFNEINNLTIYQLYDAMARLSAIDGYDKTWMGLSFGSLDKDKINFKKIDWTKPIDFEKNTIDEKNVLDKNITKK